MKIIIQIFFLFFICAETGFPQAQVSNRIDAYGKLQAGEYSEAIEAFNSLGLEANLSSSDILSLGIALFYSGEFAEARRNFQTADEKGLSDGNLWIARIYAYNRNSDDALFYIERYLKTSQNPEIEKVQQDSSFRFLHSSDKWFDLWQNEWISDFQKIEQEAQFYVRRGNFKAAHQVIDNALTDVNASNNLHLINADVYLRENNSALAINEMNQALKTEPSNTIFLQKRADSYIRLEKYEEAIKDLDQLLEADPVNFDARLMRAKTAYYAEDYELAEKDINLYIQYFESEDVLLLAGRINFQAEDYYNALKYFNQLLKEAKPKAEYFDARGLTYYETGAYALASSDFSMSLDLNPTNDSTNFYMGLAELNRHNNKAACYYWKRAKVYGNLEVIEYLQKYCK